MRINVGQTPRKVLQRLREPDRDGVCGVPLAARQGLVVSLPNRRIEPLEATMSFEVRRARSARSVLTAADDVNQEEHP
jgi:hypothetical protein